jgi:hypothetical protein
LKKIKIDLNTLTMNIKFYIPFFLVLLGASNTGFGQVTYNKRMGGPIGEAPKVATFSNGFSIDNVDRNTGTVNINIPLYEVTAHDISVPISLSYSALGLKVGQEAGAAGMGWELNAGGKINKRVNGLEDDVTPSDHSVNQTTNISLNPDNVLSDRNKLMETVMGNYDYAYDTYSYTVPSGSGRFTKNGLTFPYDPTFKYNWTSGQEIITGNGLKHQFSSGDHIIVSKKRYYKQKTDGTYNMQEIPGGEWDSKQYDKESNLYRITSSKSKDTVKFEYQLLQGVNSTPLPNRTRYTTTEQLSLNMNPKYNFGSYSWTDPDLKYSIGEPLVSKTRIETVTHYRIGAIKYPTGKVEFEYRPADLLGQDVLTKVKIYQNTNGNYKLLKLYQLNFDTLETYGHYLKSLDVLNADSVKVGSWRFVYHGYYGGKLPVVPGTESKAQDRWGFYNGVTANKTLLENPRWMINMWERPHMDACLEGSGSGSDYFIYNRPENIEFYGSQFPHEINFANRNTSFFNMLLGTLTSVTTPTGETVNYEYEPHKFYQYGYNSVHNTLYEGGGIRIKSITHNDGPIFSGKTLSKKMFTYGMGTYNSPADTEVGHGIVNIPGVVASTLYCYQFNTDITYKPNVICFSHPLNDLALYKGSFAHYPSVTESTMDGPAINHQTVYYFAHGAQTGPWNNLAIGDVSNPNFPENYANQGVKVDDVLGQPYQVIDYNGTRSGNTKARVTVNSFTTYYAPSTSPKLFSFFGGVRGMKIGQYNTYLVTCGPVTDTQGMIWQCSWLGQVPNLDPLGYISMGPEGGTEYYPGKYYGTTIELSQLSSVCKLTGTTTTTYNTIYVDPFVTTSKTYYDNINHMLPSRLVTTTSHGESKVTRIKYPYDFLSNTVPGVDLLRAQNRMDEHVEELAMVGETSPWIMAGVKNSFVNYGNLVLNNSTYRLNAGKMIPLSSYNESSSYYQPEYSFNSPDEMGNLTLSNKTNGPTTAVIWGYNQQYPVAEITNVTSMDDVAFTNFQSDNRTEWKGYWNYSGSSVLDQTSPSADKVYSLASGPITKTLPATGKKFLLGYWYKSGAVINITGVTTGPEVVKNNSGSWIFAEREILSGTALSISGTGFLDELRLCPVESMMKTYTYSPGIGITRSQDEKGQSMSYEYDSDQQLKFVRDQHGNILKGYQYHLGNYSGTGGNGNLD